MLRNPDGLRSFMNRVFSNTLPVSLSVKTRIGYDSAEERPGILDVLVDYPLAHVAIHLRTTHYRNGGLPSIKEFWYDESCLKALARVT